MSSVWPEHGFEDGLQGDLQVQFVGAGELHVDGLVSGDHVPRVVHALYPDGVFVHYVCAVRLLEGQSSSYNNRHHKTKLEYYT